MATVVWTDTGANGRYMAEEHGLAPRKFHTVWVGAADGIIPCRESDSGVPEVVKLLYVGSFIPLHGVDCLLRAMQLLSDWGHGSRFTLTLLGGGQHEAEAKSLAASLELKSVSFQSRVPFAEYCALACRYDVLLGVFGTSRKARAVIPRKVIDAMALRKPVITADTEAIREAIVHDRHAWLCPPGDAAALASGILRLSGDDRLMGRLADAGHALYREQFTIDSIGRQLAASIKEALA